MSTTSANNATVWVYQADTPPTDEEPLFMHPIMQSEMDELNRERGAWLGVVLLAMAFIAGIAVGLAVGR